MYPRMPWLCTASAKRSASTPGTRMYTPTRENTMSACMACHRSYPCLLEMPCLASHRLTPWLWMSKSARHKPRRCMLPATRHYKCQAVRGCLPRGATLQNQAIPKTHVIRCKVGVAIHDVLRRMQRSLTSIMPSFPGRSPLKNFPKSNLSSCWPTGLRGLACRACCPLSRLGSVSVLACTQSKHLSQLNGDGTFCQGHADSVRREPSPAGCSWVVAECVPTCRHRGAGLKGYTAHRKVLQSGVQ